MDVVYNHTPAAGQDPKSVLDKIVPGYYHRLSATGSAETSTCCSNTATEHRMMEKLMVDSVVTLARRVRTTPPSGPSCARCRPIRRSSRPRLTSGQPTTGPDRRTRSDAGRDRHGDRGPASGRHLQRDAVGGHGDPVVKGAAYEASSGSFTVPARTTAVFVG
jgi:hypothetical protein